MGINYYNRRRTKLLDQIHVYTFDTKSLSAGIDSILETAPNLSTLRVKIVYLLPNEQTDFIQEFYRDGTIKSHELHEIVNDICAQIENNLHATVSHFNSYSEMYSQLQTFQMSYIEKYSKIEEKKRQFIIIDLIHHAPARQRRLLLTFLSSLFSEKTNFCEKIYLSLYQKSAGKNDKLLKNLKLQKVPIKEMSSFLTLDVKDDIVLYYSEEKIRAKIFEYFYPLSSGPITKITLDKLRKEVPVKKSLRIKQHNEEYVKIAEYFGPQTTNTEFVRIIAQNDISGFYCGTSDIEGNLRYLVIDIDVSSFLRKIFSRNVIYKFLLEICKKIIRSSHALGIDGYPFIKFSGARGLHIIYRYDKEVLNDEMKRLNLSNYFYQFPGLWDLFKANNSPIKSKTSFSRLLADALCIYTIFLQQLEIPSEIQQFLGKKTHQKQLFSLSSFDINEIAILLDTSPCSNGVFRTGFSIHPSSNLASIPINDPKTGEIFYDNFNELLDDATTTNITDHCVKEDTTFQHYGNIKESALITKHTIETLLEPHKLLPCIAFIMRFTRRFAIKRPAGSFFYWYTHYQIKFATQYIQKIVLKDNESSKKAIFRKIGRILKECNFSTRRYILDFVKSYFCKEDISYPNFCDRIQGMYYFEFYYRIRPHQIRYENESQVKGILSDESRRREFLQRLHHMLLIVLNILSLWQKRGNRLRKKKKEHIKRFYMRVAKFINFQGKIREQLTTITPQETLIREFLILIAFYNILIDFLKNYYTFTQIQMNTWRAQQK